MAASSRDALNSLREYISTPADADAEPEVEEPPPPRKAAPPTGGGGDAAAAAEAGGRADGGGMFSRLLGSVGQAVGDELRDQLDSGARRWSSMKDAVDRTATDLWHAVPFADDADVHPPTSARSSSSERRAPPGPAMGPRPTMNRFAEKEKERAVHGAAWREEQARRGVPEWRQQPWSQAPDRFTARENSFHFA